MLLSILNVPDLVIKVIALLLLPIGSMNPVFQVILRFNRTKRSFNKWPIKSEIKGLNLMYVINIPIANSSSETTQLRPTTLHKAFREEGKKDGAPSSGHRSSPIMFVCEGKHIICCITVYDMISCGRT